MTRPSPVLAGEGRLRAAFAILPLAIVTRSRLPGSAIWLTIALFAEHVVEQVVEQWGSRWAS